MKSRKENKRSLKPIKKDEIDETFSHGKKRNDKVKYKHKNHWLAEEDDDYTPPKYKDEEE